MSGIAVRPVTARVSLWCQKCAARWKSDVYEADRPVRAWEAPADAAQPAFDAGWRVYVGQRSQHTYCPKHGPTVPMRQIHPTPTRTETSDD